MEITHGQWLYRNVQVHDSTQGVLVSKRKEDIQNWIEEQLTLGDVHLEGPDEYLLDINLEGLENTSGETQEYWLLAFQSARTANEL